MAVSPGFVADLIIRQSFELALGLSEFKFETSPTANLRVGLRIKDREKIERNPCFPFYEQVHLIG